MPFESIRSVLTLTGIELGKMARQRFALTTCLLPLAVAVLLPQAPSAFDDPERGYHVLARTLELSLLVACYLVLLHASLSLASERHDRTLRNLLVAPVRRAELVLSRWLALELATLLLAAALVAATYASTATRFEFGDIRGEAIEPLAEAGELRRFTLVALGYLVPPLVALVSLGLLVSVVSATPASAAGLGLGVFFLLDIGKSIFPGSSPFRLYFFNYYLPTLFDRSSYLHGVAAYAEGRGDVLWMDDAPEHVFCLLVPLVTAAICVAALVFVFSRRDCTE
jgi:ABC-type transport system involved in multi-copper enzyme maturation permease subunit